MDAAKHLKHLHALWGQVGKALGLPEGTQNLPAAQLQLHQAGHCGLWALGLVWGSAELGTGILSWAASPWIAVTAPASLPTWQSLPKLWLPVGWAPAPGVSRPAGSFPLLAV